MSEFQGPAAPARRSDAPDALPIDRVMEPVRRGLRGLGVALLAAMLALPALQVVMREVLRAPFIGVEELTRFMLICVVFVTLPYVVSSGANIRMEEMIGFFPERLRRLLYVLITATGAATFGIAALSVAVATLRNLNNATPTLGIPYWVFFSAAFLGLLLAAVECAIQFTKVLAREPLYVTFAAEQAAEDDIHLGLDHLETPAGRAP